MRVRVEEILNQKETEVVIRCQKRDESVDKVVAALAIFDQSILVKKDGRTFPLSPGDVFYFESVDEKVFVYTKGTVFESGLRLYEVEELLKNTTFLRVNKNTIVDTGKIVSFKPTLNGRMEAKLHNGESVEISRSYVSALRLMLGGTTK